MSQPDMLGRIVLTISILCTPFVALAATKTWDGGGANNLWSTAANWDSDTRPGTGDTIVFDGTGQKDAIIATNSFNYPIGSLQFTSSNTGTLTIAKPVIIQNLFLTGGTLSVQGGSQITLKGSWFNGGGTFTAGTGSVVLSGSGNAYTFRDTGTFQNLSLNDGLTRYWRFDDGAGATAIDSTGGGSTATLANMNPSTDWLTDVASGSFSFENGGSVEMHGGDDQISIANASECLPRQQGTITHWLRPNAFDSNTRMMGVYQSNGSSVALDGFGSNGVNLLEVHTALNGSSNAWNFTYQDGTGTSKGANGGTPVAGQWAFVVATWDRSGSGRLFVNGSEVGGFTMAGVSYANLTSDTCFIGRPEKDSSGRHFNGSLDDVRIYNRALSHSEIQALYAGNQGTGSGSYTLGSALTVHNNLNLYSGTLDVSSSNYAITASGSFINNATFIPRSGTVTLNGIGTTLKMYGTSLYNLTISSAKSAILRTAATVTNAISIAANAILTLNGNTLTATSTSITNLGLITEGTGSIVHTPTVAATASLFIGSTIAITVTDTSANLDGTSIETITANVGGETITLTETTVSSGIFQGSIPTLHGPFTENNGIIDRNDACGFDIITSYNGVTASTIVTDTAASCEVSQGGGGSPRGSPGRGGTAPTIIDGTITSPTETEKEGNEQQATSNEEPSSIFSDVPTTAWFFDAVMEMLQRRIISGYADIHGNLTGFFGPADPVTVGQIIKIALLSSNHQLPSSLPLPKNPTATDWSAPYIALAETLNITLSSEDVLRPATRGEVVSALLEAADIAFENDLQNPFSDLDASHTHAATILTATKLGIVKGDDPSPAFAGSGQARTVRPDAPVNRAEVSVLVMRMLER